jgi:hypothetical protein
MFKHFILLLPRLIIEWWKDIQLFENRIKKYAGLNRSADGTDRAYVTRYGVSTLPLQAIEMVNNHKYPNPMYYNGASVLLNRGNPVKLLHDSVDDSFHRLGANDFLDIAACSYISLKPIKSVELMYPEEVDITMEKLDIHFYNLTTQQAIVLMSLYGCCGKGLVWPRKHYTKLFRLYKINLLLKPIQTDYRVVMAIYSLAKTTQNPIWKFLYKINSRHTKIEDMEKYA